MENRKTSTSLALTIFMMVALACFDAGACRAGTIALSFSSSSPSSAISAGNSYGFQFTTLANIFVDSLGYIDIGQNGLAAGHQVGIWDSSGTLLFSTSLSTGTLAGPVLAGSQFSYTAITPVFLAAGNTYTIGAEEDSSDAIYYDFAATQTSSAPSLLTVSSAGFYTIGSFSEPTSTIGNHYDIVNFTAVTATPEPPSMGLAAFGLTAILFAAFARCENSRLTCK